MPFSLRTLFSITCVQRCVLALSFGASMPLLDAAITNVQLQTSVPSPQLLGTVIQLTASGQDSNLGILSYKFEVEAPGATSFSLLEDFDVINTFTWVPNYSEGIYQLRVTVRDYKAGTSAQTVVPFTVQPLVTGTLPVVVPTSNPLVALFGAPNCPAGSTMAVVFQLEGSSVQTSTDARSCHPGSENFYIGGMMASSTYSMHAVVTTGNSVTESSTVSFTTGVVPASLTIATSSVPVSPEPGTDTSSDIVLSGYSSSPEFPVATDLNGNLLWYYVGNLQLVRPVPGGTFLAFPDGFGTGTGTWPGISRRQILREFDVAGNIVRETNADRVYEQLQALGLSDPLSYFNHDAIRLANGETIVIGEVQRIYPAGTQGSKTSIDIIGDAVITLDNNFQVLNYWNAFDHVCASKDCLHINAAGDYNCVQNATTGVTPQGCPEKLLSSPANDWLHMNSLQYLTADGDILASLRSQNAIVKIDYENGTGTGDILWVLGPNGSFTLQGTLGEPYPWFSGQHNASFLDAGETTLIVFDNGTTRHEMYGGDSRGQVWSVNQTNMTAQLVFNADLGVYSGALGSAELLENGDYNFFAGDVFASSSYGAYEVQSTEFAPSGTVQYQYQANGEAFSYRGWRLQSLYQSTLNGVGGPE